MSAHSASFVFRSALLCLFASATLAPAQAQDAAVADKPAAEAPAKSDGAPAKDDGDTTKPAEPQTAEPQTIKLADGKLLLPVPGTMKAVKPRNRIIHHEFAIPPAKSDDTPGRMTIMPSGGGIKANIARWEGQFKSADGKPLGDDAKKVEEKKIGDLTIHVVDFTGTYLDSIGGPFSGRKVDRPDYRMLAAIIPLSEATGGQGGGTWFIKAYGPATTMKAAEKGFAEMIKGAKLAK